MNPFVQLNLIFNHFLLPAFAVVYTIAMLGMAYEAFRSKR